MAALKKMRVLGLRKVNCTVMSTTTATLEVLMSIGSLQPSICVPAAKVNQRIKEANEIRYIKDCECKQFITVGVLEMPSDMIARMYVFEKKYDISPPTTNSSYHRRLRDQWSPAE